VRAFANDFPIETAVGKTYDVLSAARFCLVASGTATLETALFGVPMAILYKTSSVNYAIAKWFVRIRHIGLANILADREIVPEFIQGAAARSTVLPAALDLIGDTPARARMLADLAALRAALGGPGASERAAREILDMTGSAAHA
jgi:lipid-A-disaccharide synthase